MDLLERDAERAKLDAALARASGGHGSAILIAGEAGIGKTALVREFCDEHATDATVLWGVCDALDTPRPLGPLYDIARAAGGPFAEAMTGERPPHERFVAFWTRLLTCPIAA